MLGTLKDWFNTTLLQVAAQSPTALAIGHSRSNRTALIRFVNDGTSKRTTTRPSALCEALRSGARTTYISAPITAGTALR